MCIWRAKETLATGDGWWGRGRGMKTHTLSTNWGILIVRDKLSISLHITCTHPHLPVCLSNCLHSKRVTSPQPRKPLGGTIYMMRAGKQLKVELLHPVCTDRVNTVSSCDVTRGAVGRPVCTLTELTFPETETNKLCNWIIWPSTAGPTLPRGETILMPTRNVNRPRYEISME